MKRKLVPKVSKLDAFHGDRAKLMAYVTQVRIYVWADGHCTEAVGREDRYVDDQVMYAAPYLRGDAYARFQPYISKRLEAGSWFASAAAVKTLF